MLPKIDQSAFSTYDSSIIYPLTNKFGQIYATYFERFKVRNIVLLDALSVAYNKVDYARQKDKHYRPVK
jgi:hypothetical protein